MRIKLCDILVPKPGKHLYTIQELYTLEIGQGFIVDLSTRLGLTYQENIDQEGNLCFINNREVRAEHRTVCTKNDIIRMITATLPKNYVDMNLDEIPFPTNARNFWESVQQASNSQSAIET